MDRKFIVLLESAIPAQDDLFLSWIKDSQLGWWHWLPNAWLLTSNVATTTVTEIRDKVKELYGGERNLVLDAESATNWSGWGPLGDKQDDTSGNYFTWLQTTWIR